jgi:hypothetical protein
MSNEDASTFLSRSMENLKINEYQVDHLAHDQKQALAMVMHAVHQYCHGYHVCDKKILRLTVSGVAGSGKSTWINTLVTLMRKIFYQDNTISVFAPTGSAAFNAGGQTLHRGFKLPMKLDQLELSGTKTKFLLENYSRTLIIIIDERSMLDANMLGISKHYMQKCAHGGGNEKEPWGGIPIVIFVGDDYQLPPIMPGAFYALKQNNVELSTKMSSQQMGVCAKGYEEFKKMAETSIYLLGEKRVNEGQDCFKRLLAAVRCEDPEIEMTKDEVQTLLHLHLSHQSFSDQQRREIENDATYIFANKEPRDKLNSLKLRLANLKGNPVTIIKAKTRKQSRPIANNSHFDLDRHPNRLLICKEARVSLNGCNPDPKHGLYHGALGSVRDIIYHIGESPERGDFPAYVLVEFYQYCGKDHIPNMPKYIPVAPITVRCNFGCCEKTYMPLSLAYGKTAHTFQGQNVGPVAPGRPKNPIQRIIVDPGTRKFEATNVGLFYQLLSRATTIGDQGDKLSSAIYFDGPNFSEERFKNLTMSVKNEIYKKAELRQEWVKNLRTNEVKNQAWNNEKMQILFKWAIHTRIDSVNLMEIIKTHTRNNKK